MFNLFSSIFYGLTVASALVIGNFLLWRNGKKDDLTINVIFDWSLVLTASAIIIGRLFFITEHWSAFSQDIFRWIHFIKYPGLSAKGAIIGGVIVSWIYLHFKKTNTGAYFDLLVLPFLYTNFLIQIGCLLNSCQGNFQLKSLYFLFVTIALIYLFKVLKKEKIYGFFFPKEVNEQINIKSVLGTYFLTFLSIYALTQLILDNFFGNPVYLKNFNIKVLYSLVLFIVATVLLIVKIGFKRLNESYKTLKKGKS